MAESGHEIDDDNPEEPARPEESKEYQDKGHQPIDLAVVPWHDTPDDMASVELTHGEEVQRGNEKPCPARHGDGMGVYDMVLRQGTQDETRQGLEY